MTRNTRVWKAAVAIGALALTATAAPAASADPAGSLSACELVNTGACTTGEHIHPTSGGFVGAFQGTVKQHYFWGPPDNVRVFTHTCTGIVTGLLDFGTAQCTSEGPFVPNNVPFEFACEAEGTGVGVCIIYNTGTGL